MAFLPSPLTPRPSPLSVAYGDVISLFAPVPHSWAAISTFTWVAGLNAVVRAAVLSLRSIVVFVVHLASAKGMASGSQRRNSASHVVRTVGLSIARRALNF